MDLVLDPFAHSITDGLFDDDLLDQVVGEFPDPLAPEWSTFDNAQERKQACEDPDVFGDATDYLLSQLFAPDYCDHLGREFAIPGLVPSTYGGGYHQILRGGFLEMHVDFNRGHNGLFRRLNHLVFLNRDYDSSYGGQLVLAGTPTVSIEPRFNRTAIFATSEESWHGHPIPWDGPQPRRSIAVYYYSFEPASDAPEHSTIFR